MTTGIRQKDKLFQLKVDDLVRKAQDGAGGFARVYKMYQRLQTQRFETENASEGDPWAPLNSKYKEYKLKRYGGGPRRKSKKRVAGTWNSYPGSGTKMMVGTGMIAGAAIGPGSPFSGVTAHRAMFTDRQMTIRVEESGVNPDGDDFDYAHLASESRPFMTFGDPSLGKMKDELAKFVLEF